MPRVTTFNKRRMLRLQEFDEALVGDRFPNLEEVVVEVCPEYAPSPSAIVKVHAWIIFWSFLLFFSACFVLDLNSVV